MREPASEDGLGLIEVVVAMVVLAILAIAMVPLLMQGLIQSKANVTIAAATQFVDAELDRANASTACGAVPTGVVTETDSRGVTITITRTRGACPATYPGTVSFTISAVRADTGASLVTAETLVYVTGG